MQAAARRPMRAGGMTGTDQRKGRVMRPFGLLAVSLSSVQHWRQFLRDSSGIDYEAASPAFKRSLNL